MNTIIFGKAAVDLVYNDIKEIEELEKKNAKLREEAGKNGSEVVFEDSIKAPRRFYPADEARRLLAICRRHLQYGTL